MPGVRIPTLGLDYEGYEGQALAIYFRDVKTELPFLALESESLISFDG